MLASDYLADTGDGVSGTIAEMRLSNRRSQTPAFRENVAQMRLDIANVRSL